MNPLVSVIIPVYNRESTIGRALNSVLDQTYKNIEVIIVDDCSTDLTIENINNCMDDRVKVIKLSENKGANTARNIGIREASGKYIAFQDSDDEWLEDKLEKQLDYINKTSVQVVYCPYKLYEENKISIVPKEYQDTDKCEKYLVDTLREKNVIGTPTLLINKDVFDKIGFFDEQIKRLQDYEFVIRLAKNTKIGYICQPLVKAYRMPMSITSNNYLLLNAYENILKKHSDFINIEIFLKRYLKYVEVFYRGNVDYSFLEELILSIVSQNGEQEKEKLYKIVFQYFINRINIKEKISKEWYDTFKKNIKNDKFAIYGAGVHGKRAYWELKKEGYKAKKFLVTELKEDIVIDGIKVEELSKKLEDNIPIIIAVSEEKQGIIIHNLLNKEIYNFCIYPTY